MSYFKITCYRRFEETPTAFGFYADAKSDARHNARFDDSITVFLAIQSSSSLDKDLAAVRKLHERRYPGWRVHAVHLTREQFERQREIHVVV